MPYTSLLGRLDRKGFLGFRVWDFSFRSLSHRYGRTFLRKIVFRHPFRTLTGHFTYRRLVKRECIEGPVTFLFPGLEEDLQRMVAKVEGSSLVALGYCQKNLADGGCPAGRFNHHCLYLAQPDLSKPRKTPLVCRECDIKTIGTKALMAGANVYIMTTALDILHDIFVPCLEQRRFHFVILCVCPYSVHPVVLPLHICGVEGFVIQFDSGYCADYGQWSLADKGIKNERTFMSLEARNKILDFLDGVAKVRMESRKTVCHRFHLKGNTYVPE